MSSFPFPAQAEAHSCSLTSLFRSSRLRLRTGANDKPLATSYRLPAVFSITCTLGSSATDLFSYTCTFEALCKFPIFNTCTKQGGYRREQKPLQFLTKLPIGSDPWLLPATSHQPPATSYQLLATICLFKHLHQGSSAIDLFSYTCSLRPSVSSLNSTLAQKRGYRRAGAASVLDEIAHRV